MIAETRVCIACDRMFKDHDVARGRPPRRTCSMACRQAIPHRFWPKVDKNGPIHPVHGQCWEWTANKNNDGYGCFRVDGKYKKAHRVSFGLASGTEPPDELEVCHSCDNPGCVRPEHLFLGTHTANIRDCVSKGRHVAPAGEDNAKAKLTSVLVTEVKRRLAAGQRQVDVAEAMGINVITLNHIATGRTWRHVA